ncbi:MAG: [FeFe] hydrogenase, group A [Clostridia bacterium]|nr:[FeFe] hydrogenase, group A [Clostridia bacterium]
MVKVKIDGIEYEAKEGSTIFEVAKKNGIDIPSLCFLKDLNEIAACRVCLVEIEGVDRLAPSCNTKVADGMVVYTNNPRVRRARKLNLQLILSQHDGNCTTCVRSGNCELQKLANDFNVKNIPFELDVPENEWDFDAPLIKQNSKCIKCMRCIQICDKVQGLEIWDVVGSGGRTTVGLSAADTIRESKCTFCGQCVTHCPTGALTARDDTGRVEAALSDRDKVTVVQVAPAVRAAWGEAFGMTREEASFGKIVTALKRMGFDYVFDTNFTADLTIMEEGTEFLERFTHKYNYQWPMFTSCCPGWIRFIKGNYPKYVDNLSTAKSPQQMFGAVTKSYFAEKIGVDPHNIFLVSVMPCVSKKEEADLPTMKSVTGDTNDVDVVITTRELTRMMRAQHIDPKKVPETEADSPLGTGTGAAVIFGATGGVMDAALRSAYALVTGKNPDADAFTDVRGIKGWKEAKFEIPGAGTVRVAVVSGLQNTRKLMDAIDAGEVSYDFVEVMACPGGCAGGGGQPIREACELAEERGNELWRLDKNAKIRYSHENPDVKAIYDEYFGKPLSEKSHHLLHTDHHGWKMPGEE